MNRNTNIHACMLTFSSNTHMCSTRNKHTHKQETATLSHCSGFVSLTGGSLLTTFGVFLNSFKMCCLHSRHLSGDVTSWLDRAKEDNGGRYSETHVENVKVLARLFPLYSLQLLYRACITQAGPWDRVT